MTTHTPKPSVYGSMAPMPNGTNKVLMLNAGNARAFNYFTNSTFEWDGTDWSEISSADVNSLPPPHSHGVLAYDGTAMMSFGGAGNDGSVRNTTHTYRNGVWVAQSPITSPSGRYRAAAAYLAAGSTGVVMFGGTDNEKLLNDTYIWSGSNWSKASPATVPPGRYNHSMAASATIVLMGFGSNTLRELSDVWSYDGSVWSQLTVSGDVPPARSESCMTYDSAQSLFIVFSGIGDSDYLSDCYTSPTGAVWTRVSGTLPPARRGASLAYDATSATSILWGGLEASTGKPSSDTWSFNAGTRVWTKL